VFYTNRKHKKKVPPQNIDAHLGELKMADLISQMIEDIKSSKLGSTEKTFLVIEWILREYTPYELQKIRLDKLKKEIESSLKSYLPTKTRKLALKKIGHTFNVSDDEKALSLLIGLAYFSYIDNEFVYDKVMRKEMLSKETRVGFSPSEIELLYEKWAEVFGTAEELFNKV